MTSLILSILFSSSLLIFFKFFEKYSLNAIVAIGMNYLVAACLGIYFLKSTLIAKPSIDFHWVYISLGLGVLFSLIFNLARYTTQKVGLGITSVAMKLGVIYPVVIGIVFYHESFQAINYLGLILGLIAIFLINKPSEKLAQSLLFLPLLVWVGSGICDSSVQYINQRYPLEAENGSFAFLCFWSAGLSSFIFIFYKKYSLDWKSILAGAALGIPNYFSIYYLLRALEDMKDNFQMSSSNLFMINNLTIVIISVALGIFCFKERLNRFNYLGIILSLVALILINY